MLRDQIKKDLENAIGKVGQLAGGKVEVTRTIDSKFGDFSTNAALKIKLSDKQSFSANKQSPIEFAKKLADSLYNLPYIEKLEVAGPGFINFFIKDSFWQKQVSDVLKSGKNYGSNNLGKSKKARVEFVSANPTGPLHFGNARGGPIGDSLASVLEFCGFEVLREYYHNDVGGQVEKLAQSIFNLAIAKKLEEQEYKGEYVRELMQKFLLKTDEQKSSWDFKNPTNPLAKSASTKLGKESVDFLLEQALDDCKKMGIEFDKVYSESDFFDSSKTVDAIDKLEKKGVLKAKDGAVWFAPNDKFLNDRETVVIKSDGSYTYFANDIAYHDLKFSEGADLVIDVFGANHHGHIPRLQAAISALGYDERKFHVILYQWVRFKRGGELVKMSKRSGTFVTAREVIDEVGKDAVRFMILSHDANSHIDFDLDLAREQTNKNPVFYVQYAYARICSILAKSKSARELKSESKNINYSLLKTKFELELIKEITKLPELVENIASNFGVNQLTTYSTSLADSFHRFYENCQVIGEDKDLEAARLALVSACKITLENTLGLLGVSAPERM